MENGKKKIVFFGTSEICIPFLELLINEFSIELIITQPDSFGGRKKKLIEPAVKKYALSKNIRYLQPAKLNKDIAKVIKNIDPDISIVISYGKFIPGKIFKIPRFKTVNVHFSILPKFRGAAPYQRAIEKGSQSTGITIFEISSEMDTGDIWATKKCNISPDDTSITLADRMSKKGAPFLISTLKKIIEGTIEKKTQDHSSATFAKIVKKDEGRVNWNHDAKKIYNKFRAFHPWPGSFYYSLGKKISIKKMRISNHKSKNPAGNVLSVSKDALIICCGANECIEISMILPQGKKEMTPYIFSIGNKIPEKLD